VAGRRFGMELSDDRVEIWARGDGLVFQEPAVIARSSSGRVFALGSQAVRIVAEEGSETELVHPFGIFELRDRDTAEQMLRQLITRVVGRLVFVRHELVLAVSAELSTTARRVLLEAALASGARMAHLLDLPLALAFGAGLPVTSWDPMPVMFLLPDSVQAAIVCHHGLLASRAIELGESDDSATAWADPDRVEIVAGMVRDLVAEAPASASRRIASLGLTLAGRGVDLQQVGRMITGSSGLPTRVVADPEHCVVKGAEVALERIEAAGGRTLLYLR
jgi:actin-like ATPase involved in cell morphogenesis